MLSSDHDSIVCVYMLQGNGSTIAVLGPPGTEQGGLYCDMILRRLMFDALTHYSTS